MDYLLLLFGITVRCDLVISGAVGFLTAAAILCFRKNRGRSRRFKAEHVTAEKEELLSSLGHVKCYDLTADITPKTIVYPGDPTFEVKEVAEIGSGCCFKLVQMSLGNHTGTHIDFPRHVIPGGKNSDDYSIDELIGNGLIVEIPSAARSVTAEHVRRAQIRGGDFVFFKTANSELNKQGAFTEDFVFIEPEAAKALLDLKVRVVGIDYISVDSCHAEELPVHKLLLGNNVLIVENLELDGINPGRCRIHINPIKIAEMDGLPARVLMLR